MAAMALEQGSDVGRKRKRLETPTRPSSPKWFVRALGEPGFGLRVRLSRQPIFKWEAANLADCGTREPNIDVRDNDPDATYAADKRNTDEALQRMQTIAQNYQQQQPAETMTWQRMQKNLQGYKLSNSDEEPKKIPVFILGCDQQSSTQARTSWRIQKIVPNEILKCSAQATASESALQQHSAQVRTSWRIQKLMPDDKQQTSAKSMCYRITRHEHSTNAKTSLQIQKLVRDDMEKPSAQFTASRTAVQQDSAPATTSWGLQKLVPVYMQQRSTKSMSFRITPPQHSGNSTNSLKMQKNVPCDLQQPSAEVTTSRITLKQEDLIPAMNSWRVDKLASHDMKQRSAKSMAFRAAMHRHSVKAVTSLQMPKFEPCDMQQHSEQEINPVAALQEIPLQAIPPVAALQQFPAQAIAPMTALQQQSTQAMTSFKMPKLEPGDMKHHSVQAIAPMNALLQPSPQANSSRTGFSLQPGNLARFIEKKPRSTRVRNEHPHWYKLTGR